jgi:AcrR family transcriptional regulator
MVAKRETTTSSHATKQLAAMTPKGRATRRRLLEAAQHLLRERGSVEIADVASMAEVAQSVIYRYFGNKAGLIEAVVNDFYDVYDESVFLAPLAPGASWPERELLRIEQEIAFLYDHPLGPVVVAGLLHEAAATRIDAERQRRHAEMAARNIRHAQKNGELPRSINPDLVGAAIIGALRSVMAAALSSDDPPSAAEVTATVACLSQALITPPAIPVRAGAGTGPDVAGRG